MSSPYCSMPARPDARFNVRTCMRESFQGGYASLGAARANGVCLAVPPFLFVSFRYFSFLRLFPLVMLGVALTAHVQGATVHVQSLPAIHSFLSILYTLGRRRPVIAYDLLEITHALFYVSCVSLVLFNRSSDLVLATRLSEYHSLQ